MTRIEFIENVETFDDLIEFCNNEECYELEDFYSETAMDEDIGECIEDCSGDYHWWELKDKLNSIPTYSETGYFLREGGFSWSAVDEEDFEEYKQRVLRWMDDNGYWEEEEEYDDDDDTYLDMYSVPEDEEEEDDVAPMEEFQVGELIGMCGIAFFGIVEAEEKERQEEERAFSGFVSAFEASNKRI